MLFDIVEENYKDVYKRQKQNTDKAFIVQFGNETYEPVSQANKEIEYTYSIKETMENVGKHKIPDCIVVKNVFTLIVYDKNGKVNKADIIKSIGFLKLMCEKYEVKSLVFIDTSFGKIMSSAQLKNILVKYFSKGYTNLYLTNSKRRD